MHALNFILIFRTLLVCKGKYCLRVEILKVAQIVFSIRFETHGSKSIYEFNWSGSNQVGWFFQSFRTWRWQIYNVSENVGLMTLILRTLIIANFCSRAEEHLKCLNVIDKSDIELVWIGSESKLVRRNYFSVFKRAC